MLRSWTWYDELSASSPNLPHIFSLNTNITVYISESYLFFFYQFSPKNHLKFSHNSLHSINKTCKKSHQFTFKPLEYYPNTMSLFTLPMALAFPHTQAFWFDSNLNSILIVFSPLLHINIDCFFSCMKSITNRHPSRRFSRTF